jgi:hypothetical protein
MVMWSHHVPPGGPGPPATLDVSESATSRDTIVISLLSGATSPDLAMHMHRRSIVPGTGARREDVCSLARIARDAIGGEPQGTT